jgi:hypothetical protein
MKVIRVDTFCRSTSLVSSVVSSASLVSSVVLSTSLVSSVVLSTSLVSSKVLFRFLENFVKTTMIPLKEETQTSGVDWQV